MVRAYSTRVIEFILVDSTRYKSKDSRIDIELVETTAFIRFPEDAL